jgi:hypothetical protein
VARRANKRYNRQQTRRWEQVAMRAFLAACVVTIILAACAVLALGAMQKPSGIAFSTDGVRIDPSWSWRQAFGGSASNPQDKSAAAPHPGPENCEKISAYRWPFVDLGEAKENDACLVSQ